MVKVTFLDYGAGNIRSLRNALIKVSHVPYACVCESMWVLRVRAVLAGVRVRVRVRVFWLRLPLARADACIFCFCR